MTGLPVTADEITVMTEATAWRATLPSAQRLAKQAIRTALKITKPRRRRAIEICLVLSDDRRVQKLNHTFRRKDKPTNVLSFPAEAKVPRHLPLVLGDIVLALGVLKREARESRKPLQHHFQHLVVHGLLHLLNYDHIIEADALHMEAMERRILAHLNVPDPYADI